MMAVQKVKHRDFPGSPVVKTLHFQCKGHGFDPFFGELRSHMPKKKVIRRVTIWPRILLLGIHPRELKIYVHIKTCT